MLRDRICKISKQSQKGQTLVEFAVTIPILLMLAAGTIQLGMAMNDQLLYYNAAKEGVMAVALARESVCDPADPNQLANRAIVVTEVITRANRVLEVSGVDTSNVTFQPVWQNIRASSGVPDYCQLRLTITGNRMFPPIFGGLFNIGNQISVQDVGFGGFA